MMTKSISDQELTDKAIRFCNYRPRCSNEVFLKLKSLGANDNTASKITSRLAKAKIFDDEYFATAFAEGKVRNNKWGRIKIQFELRNKGIEEPIIKKAINSIDEDEYLETIIKVAKIKLNEIKENDKRLKFRKAMQYLANKGYENNIVINVLNDILD